MLISAMSQVAVSERGAERRTTRLAPSPTGALHLGNAFAFVLTWLIARQRGWRIVLRIDDLDGPRVKPGAAQAAMKTLSWLGLDWEGQPDFELRAIPEYREWLRQLAGAGEIYPCRCTRSQIEAASRSAPHAGQHEIRYPGTCRPSSRASVDFDDRRFDGAAWRLRVEPGAIPFVDEIAGEQRFDVEAAVGDFLVATKERLPAYQLAVVIDDKRQAVTDVIRGADLLASTARQLLIKERLGVLQGRYWHLPLIVGPDGLRLAKRHGDTRVDFYRGCGVPVERLLGLIAFWAGAQPSRKAISLVELQTQFDIALLPRQSIVFGDEDHQWLLARTSERV